MAALTAIPRPPGFRGPTSRGTKERENLPDFDFPSNYATVCYFILLFHVVMLLLLKCIPLCELKSTFCIVFLLLASTKALRYDTCFYKGL